MLIIAVVLGILWNGGGGGYHEKDHYHYDVGASRHQNHDVLNGSVGQSSGVRPEDAGDEDQHLHHPIFTYKVKKKGTGKECCDGEGKREMRFENLYQNAPRKPARVTRNPWQHQIKAKRREILLLKCKPTKASDTGNGKVSGVGSCLPTDEPATAKHRSLCSSGVEHVFIGKKAQVQNPKSRLTKTQH